MSDRSLSAPHYTDEQHYRHQLERFFLPSWQFATPADTFHAPGSLKPWWFAEGSLHEPVLLTVDGDGRKHALSNVCTHRARLLVEQAGQGKMIRCGYHGRCFAADGRMHSMPGMDGVAGFPAPEDNLRSFAYEEVAGLGFVALEPRERCATWLEPVLERTSFLPWHRLVYRPEHSRDYPLAAHWALYVDNYLEGFHIPFVHPALTQQLSLKAYAYEQFPGGTLQIGFGNGKSPVFTPPEGHPDYARGVAAYYFWLFPNLMLNLYPWGLSLNQVLPQAIDKTIVRYHTLVWDDDQWGQGAGADTHQVELEDQAVVEAVQRGIRSRYWQPGLYASRHEQGVRWFHTMLRQA